MEKLRHDGMVTTYVHGGYELTEVGRAIAASRSAT